MYVVWESLPARCLWATGLAKVCTTLAAVAGTQRVLFQPDGGRWLLEHSREPMQRELAQFSRARLALDSAHGGAAAPCAECRASHPVAICRFDSFESKGSGCECCSALARSGGVMLDLARCMAVDPLRVHQSHFIQRNSAVSSVFRTFE